jgi:hypothetical protein
MKRFNPGNIMHVLHDDLLPAFYTLREVAGSVSDTRLVFMENWQPGSLAYMYELLGGPKVLVALKWALVLVERPHGTLCSRVSVVSHDSPGQAYDNPRPHRNPIIAHCSLL